MLSAICFNLDQSKILSSGNALKCGSDALIFAIKNTVRKGENVSYLITNDYENAHMNMIYKPAKIHSICCG